VKSTVMSRSSRHRILSGSLINSRSHDGPATPPVDVPTVVGPPRLRFLGIRW
jgi:hypothetical protein